MHLPVRESPKSLRDQSLSKRLARRKGTRASRACWHCHSRKVRCVQSTPDDPCANCRIDGRVCILRAVRNRYRTGLRNRSRSKRASGSGVITTPRRSSTASSQPCPPQSVNFDSDFEEQSSAAKSSREPQLQTVVYSGQPSFRLVQLQFPFLDLSTISRLPVQSAEHLIDRGCLTIPPRHALDVIMEHYFLYTHPFLPIINESSFWSLYRSKKPVSDASSTGKVSLLVLYGMMFVSCSFLSESLVCSMGFRSIHEAKSIYYRRAKLLYNLDYERSAVSIAQAALLLSQSHLAQPPGESCLTGTTWLSIAVYNARKAGAHEYHLKGVGKMDKSFAGDASLANTLKRLWWCCIIRDRILPLTARCPIQITRSNFDFDCFPPLTLLDLSDEICSSEVYDALTKASLVNILAKLVELCIILTDVLTWVFDNDQSTLTAASSHQNSEANRMESCRSALKDWHSTIPLQAHEQDWGPENVFLELHDRSVILYMNAMNMYYHSAMLALCHHDMLVSGYRLSLFDLDLFYMDDFQNNTEMQYAASQVTSSLNELVRLHLVRWLPISAIGCTAFPLALQIIDVKISLSSSKRHLQSQPAPDEFQRQCQQLDTLVQALTTYRSRYISTDWVAQAVRSITELFDDPTLSTERLSGHDSTGSISSWADIARYNPKLYLRLATTMDLAIRNGSLPREHDFPVILREDLGVLLDPLRNTSVTGGSCAGGMHSSNCMDSSKLSTGEEFKGVRGPVHECTLPGCLEGSISGPHLLKSSSPESVELAPGSPTLGYRVAELGDLDICRLFDTGEKQDREGYDATELEMNNDLSLVIDTALLNTPFLDLDWGVDNFAVEQVVDE